MEETLLQQLRKSQDAELGLRNALDTVSIGYWSWVRGEAMEWDGLAICKKVIDRLGGSIEFESRKKGGSTFYVRLKKAAKPSESP